MIHELTLFFASARFSSASGGVSVQSVKVDREDETILVVKVFEGINANCMDTESSRNAQGKEKEKEKEREGEGEGEREAIAAADADALAMATKRELFEATLDLQKAGEPLGRDGDGDGDGGRGRGGYTDHAKAAIYVEDVMEGIEEGGFGRRRRKRGRRGGGQTAGQCCEACCMLNHHQPICTHTCRCMMVRDQYRCEDLT